jgi:hypothetical protein
VTITYPIHPHYGRVLRVWRTFKEGGARLVVEAPNGLRRLVPVEWTNRCPTKPCARIGSRPVLFEADLLARAASLIAEKLAQPAKMRPSTVIEAPNRRSRAEAARAEGAGGDDTFGDERGARGSRVEVDREHRRKGSSRRRRRQ